MQRKYEASFYLVFVNVQGIKVYHTQEKCNILPICNESLKWGSITNFIRRSRRTTLYTGEQTFYFYL